MVSCNVFKQADLEHALVEHILSEDVPSVGVVGGCAVKEQPDEDDDDDSRHPPPWMTQRYGVDRGW